jgi:hypothetical protein
LLAVISAVKSGRSIPEVGTAYKILMKAGATFSACPLTGAFNQEQGLAERVLTLNKVALLS